MISVHAFQERSNIYRMKTTACFTQVRLEAMGNYPVTVEIKNGQVAWAKINFSGRDSRLNEIEYTYERANVEESRKQGRLVMESV